MVLYSELPAQNYPAYHFSAHNSLVQELPASNHTVPIPAAYQQHPSYSSQKISECKPRISDEWNHSTITEYTRMIAILVMIMALILMLTPLILWEKAQKESSSVDEFPPITTKPCVMFATIASMNFAISIVLLVLSLMSSKFRKSIAFMNAVFAIIATIGFSSAMGACFYLTGLTKGLPNKMDLWKWSCDNYRKGNEIDALDFHFVCKSITLSWNFGLLQSTLELYTIIVSGIAFALIKYHHFAKYGRVGKIF